MVLEKNLNNAKSELNQIQKYNHLQSADFKYQKLQEEEYILQKNYENADKSLKQMIDEIKKLMDEYSHLTRLIFDLK